VIAAPPEDAGSAVQNAWFGYAWAKVIVQVVALVPMVNWPAMLFEPVATEGEPVPQDEMAGMVS